jgi:hypothetical protein
LIRRDGPHEDTEPVPPFGGKGAVNVSSWTEILNEYEEAEAEMDRTYKGRIWEVERIDGTPLAMHVDREGRKYVSHWVRKGTPPRWTEGIRCYIYHPDNPVVVDGSGAWSWASSWGVKGVCKGRKDGLVILENCSFVRYFFEGNDW